MMCKHDTQPGRLDLAPIPRQADISNVPAVLLLKPVMVSMPDPETAWLLLAMSSTLAGNLTILGSIANIIVVEGARPRIAIGFAEYLKVGVPLTLATIVLGSLWLTLVPY